MGTSFPDPLMRVMCTVTREDKNLYSICCGGEKLRFQYTRRGLEKQHNPTGQNSAHHCATPRDVCRIIMGTIPTMTMMAFLLWLLLLIFCWPLALLALVLYPIVWLLLLPFRILGIAVEGVLKLIKAVILLPARVLRGSQ